MQDGGRTLEIFHGYQRDGLGGFPVALGFSGDAQLAYFFRRVDPGQSLKLKKGTTKVLPTVISGVQFYTFDYSDGFALGVKAPGADILGAGLELLCTIARTTKWVSRLARVGSSTVGTLSAAGDLTKEETPTSQRSLVRLIWAPRKKMPQIQIGKQRISMGWLRALAQGKNYCPMAEISSSTEANHAD